MRVAIAGSSGLLGSLLTSDLVRRGHEVVRLVRHDPQGPDERRLDASAGTIGGPGLADVDAVVNFAGAGIADSRWTSSHKAAMRASRLSTTETIVAALREAPGCTTFLSGSAVGFYGDRGPTELDETSGPGRGFLASLCVDWERAAQAAPDHVRVVTLRTGHVLTERGGILGKQRLVFQLGLGGPIGDGQQYVSWIGGEDYVRACEFLLTTPAVRGPVNMTGPAPVTNAEFTRAFARSLHRPARLPMPLPVASAVFTREMVDEAMLSSQRALPRALASHGFTFVHADVAAAMAAVNR